MSVESSAFSVERSGAAGRAVLLSYAPQDAEAARRSTEALRAAGVEVGFDQSELRGGDAWDHKIRRQIKACGIFVPIISKIEESRDEAYYHAALGDREAALKAVATSHAAMDLQRNFFSYVIAQRQIAFAYARLGQPAEASGALDAVLSSPGPYLSGIFLVEPALEPIRHTPSSRRSSASTPTSSRTPRSSTPTSRRSARRERHAANAQRPTFNA